MLWTLAESPRIDLDCGANSMSELTVVWCRVLTLLARYRVILHGILCDELCVGLEQMMHPSDYNEVCLEALEAE